MGFRRSLIKFRRLSNIHRLNVFGIVHVKRKDTKTVDMFLLNTSTLQKTYFYARHLKACPPIQHFLQIGAAPPN